MIDTTGKRMASQVTSGRDYSQQGPHPDIVTRVPSAYTVCGICGNAGTTDDFLAEHTCFAFNAVQDIRDFDEFEPPAPGTRFDVGTTAIEYIGEYYTDYIIPTGEEEEEEEDSEYQFLHLDTHKPFELLLSDFLRVDGYSDLTPGFHGIWHGTINSGYLIRLTDDGEGAFLFHHWGA